MQKLNMVDADTLLYQPLDKPRFVVDGLIPTGLILFLCCTCALRIPFSAYRTGSFV